MSATKTYTIEGAYNESGLVKVDPELNHLSVACTWYSDSNYQTPEAPSAGTLAIEGRVNGNAGYSTLNLSPLDVTDNTAYANTSVPLSHVKVTPSDVDSGYYYQVIITGNDN